MTELLVGTKKGLFVLRGDAGAEKPFDVAARAFPGDVVEFAIRDPRERPVLRVRDVRALRSARDAHDGSDGRVGADDRSRVPRGERLDVWNGSGRSSRVRPTG